MDSVRAGPFGQLFRPDNFVFGQVNKTISSLYRVALVTIGLKVTTRKVLNLSIPSLMLSEKKQSPAIVFKDFKSLIHWEVELVPVWELS